MEEKNHHMWTEKRIKEQRNSYIKLLNEWDSNVCLLNLILGYDRFDFQIKEK